MASLLYVVISKVHALRACFGYQQPGRRPADRDGDGALSSSERINAFREEVSHWNPLGFALLVTLIIAPLTILYQVRDGGGEGGWG